jgi:hypothetical protein
LLDSDLLDSIDSDKALDALDEVVMEASLDSGLVVDITLDDNVTNTITFLASHKPPTFGRGSAPTPTTRSLEIILPEQARKVEVYRRATNEDWVYLTTLTSNGTITFPYSRFYAEITAVAYSDLISGLKSTDNPRTYFWDPTSDGGGGRK